ncbi:hypothetical protein [Rhodococcus coprophilus]|uniref:Uncharacterized protein n=1 Tax=Rhodococcus coprophilus TaxID=38310 RepID=A0A2X4UEA0_9NOCA|nr:hypothetical protein [Rhodococcus coprophilus]MBM7458154.1 hypothetical protein [Rhodococcus coprophilus]SQI31210.1 Uncharacterised protein [Rhodococcus coprophilus]
MSLQTHAPRAWANAVLADGAACIVHVETSGLDRSVEIHRFRHGVVNAQGQCTAQ